MSENESSRAGMMRHTAWWVLTCLLAVITLATPLSLDGVELSTDLSVDSVASDGNPIGPDLVHANPPQEYQGLSSPDACFAGHHSERPHNVHFRSTLLRYAPKQSPPHTA